MAVLLVAIVLESFAMRTAIKESNPVRGKATWVQFVRRSESPELPVILLEDAGRITRAINEAGERVRTAVPIATLVYIEPDLFRSGASPEASPGTVSSG